MVDTEAWVLHKGAYRKDPDKGQFAQLQLEKFSFPDITDEEVLAEPIWGCWEGNMNHALRRYPIDICRQRKEERVVIGNAGIVRVLKVGARVTHLSEDDLCLVFPSAVSDDLGFMELAHAYDAPRTVGLLAKRTKLHYRSLIPVPSLDRHSVEQWAAFSARFITAWANWKLAYGVWKLLHPKATTGYQPFVWGWGGGVALAELLLARIHGFPAAMTASSQQRLTMIKQLGIDAVDRRQFPDLDFRPASFETDPKYRTRYMQSEMTFLEIIGEKTRREGVSIFVEMIGLPVFRATLKSLARPAVLTTAGWKEGMDLSFLRAIECKKWHVHVHTHFARYEDGLEAVAFAEQTGWMAPDEQQRWKWDNIPALATEFFLGRTNPLFPLYEINPF